VVFGVWATTGIAQVPTGQFNYAFTNTLLWDVSGIYTNNTDPNDVVIATIEHGPTGLLSGSRTETYTTGTGHATGTASISGKVTTKSGVPEGTFTSKGEISGVINGENFLATFTAKDIVSIRPATLTAFDSNAVRKCVVGGNCVTDAQGVDLPLPEGMTGLWTLDTEISTAGDKLSGTGTLTLSNGRLFTYQITGDHNSESQLSKLKLVGLDKALGTSLSLTTSGSGMELTGLKGNVLGQKPQYCLACNTIPPPSPFISPDAGFTASSQGGSAPATIIFTDSSRGTVADRLWNYGDGSELFNTISGSVRHTYTNAGVYTVTLIVSGPVGTSEFVSSNSVLVTPMPYTGWFTNSYPLFGSSNLTIAPATAQGIFFVGDTVVISNDLPTNVELYDYHFKAIATGPPPLVVSSLPMGHYFVQCNGTNGGYGDRTEFSVLPQGYTNHPHVDFGFMLTDSNRNARLAPGLGRNQSWWVYGAGGGGGGVAVISASGSVLSNNWAVLDGVLGQYSNVTPVDVYNFIVGHGDSLYGGYGYYAAPPVDQTNSIWGWVTDVSLLFSNAAVHFGTNFIYEVPNEPGWPNIIFTNQNDVWTDPYWTNNAGALPAAMAVSATVEAVKFTCPECEVWGPAMIGFSAATDANITSYYAHVDAITHHNDVEADQPPDNRWQDCLAMNEYNQQLTSIWGKPIYITEDYPCAPSPTGKMTSWYLFGGGTGGYSRTNSPYFGWDWRVHVSRFWKELVMGKGCGLAGVENFCATFHPTFGIPLGDPISSCYGWDSDVYSTGAGPVPEVDGEAMISWWLSGSVPITNWLSGTMLTWQEATVLASGNPGLHFWQFQFADGSTNTFVWADEETTITTNFGFSVTDIYSNRWNGPINDEPVIVWGVVQP
jgi:PKD repeat protein